MLKIKQIYGFDLWYDERRRFFVITDTDGTELTHSERQDEAEIKAKSLSKQEFKRFPIVRVTHEGIIQVGELTSLNRDDKSVWVSMEKSPEMWGSGGRSKLNLKYDHNFHELTEANAKILEGIRAKHEALKQIEADIEAVVGTLEKPINMNYFGIIER